MLELKSQLQDLQQRRDSFVKNSPADIEYMNAHPNDPNVKKYQQQYEQLENRIQELQKTITTGELADLDYVYKQHVVKDQNSWFTNVFNAVGDAIKEATTYDRYLGNLYQQRRAEIENSYEQILNDYTPTQSNPLLERKNNPYASESEIQRIIKERSLMSETNRKLNKERESLTKEYISNRKHLEESKKLWQVSKGFKESTQAGQYDGLWSMDYWKYQVMPMVGSTLSSPEQAIASAINLATMAGSIAAAPISGGASAVIGLAGTAASTPYELAGAAAENYAEVGDKRIETIKNRLLEKEFTGESDEKLGARYKKVMDELKQKDIVFWRKAGWSEEMIQAHVEGDDGEQNILKDATTGIIDSNDPLFQKARLESTKGMQAHFDANMMRTAASIPIEKLIDVAVYTKNLRGYYRANKQLNKASLESQSGRTTRVTVASNGRDVDVEYSGGLTRGQRPQPETPSRSSKYRNGLNKTKENFVSGYNSTKGVGGLAGTGFGGSVATGVVGGTVNTVARTIPKVGRYMDDISSRVAMKYQHVMDRVMSHPKFGQFIKKYDPSIRAIGRIAAGTAGKAWIEGYEEAVQYLNADRDFAAEYGWNSASMWELFTNDVKQGLRTTNAILSLAGASNSELKDDAEFWANFKGGFALSMIPFHPMHGIQIAGNAVNLYKEQSVYNYFINNALMDRETDKIYRDIDSRLVHQAFKNNEQQVLEYIDREAKRDASRENPIYSQEDYAKRKQEITQLLSLAKNKNVRQKLEAKGIKYGTNKYATAIADINNMHHQQAQDNEAINIHRSNLKKLYNSKEFQDSVSQIVDDVLNNSTVDSEEIENEVKRARAEAVNNEIESILSENGITQREGKKYQRVINRKDSMERIFEAGE